MAGKAGLLQFCEGCQHSGSCNRKRVHSARQGFRKKKQGDTAPVDYGRVRALHGLRRHSQQLGIIAQALADRTGVSYAYVSLAVAVGQLMYEVNQPIFGIVAMKKSNGFVLVLDTPMMVAGLLLTMLARSVIVLVVTAGTGISSSRP